MQGDFSRWTFDPTHLFSRVLMQQGRVQLEAEWNEQVAIQWHFLRALAVDMMGPHGTWEKEAFQVAAGSTDIFTVKEQKRYYVGGVLCEASAGSQEYSIPSEPQPPEGSHYLVYLDVWERHLTHLENDGRDASPTTPGIREVALNGVDTTTRAKVVWQVRTELLPPNFFDEFEEADSDAAFLETFKGKREARALLAQTVQTPYNWPADFDRFSTLITKLNEVINALDGTGQLETSSLTPEEIYLRGVIDDQIVARLRSVIETLRAMTPLPPNSTLPNVRTYLDTVVSTFDSIGQIDPNALTSQRVYLQASIDLIVTKLNSVIEIFNNIPTLSDNGNSADNVIKRMIVEHHLRQLEQEIQETLEEIEKKIYDTVFKTSDPGKLMANTTSGEATAGTEPCTIPPDARYRGMENQLYRVEIHTGGAAGTGGTATFKWSRENGSVIFPIQALSLSPAAGGGSIATVKLANLGKDERLSLRPNDWVEIVDDHLSRQLQSGLLLQVTEVDIANVSVKLQVPTGQKVDDLMYDEKSSNHPLLRRWDQKEVRGITLPNGAIPVNTLSDIDLEDGIQVQFQGSTYRTGDYWLIPARTVTRNVEWPKEDGNPKAIPPHGIEHHYAPLAILTPNGEGFDVIDCRRLFTQLGRPLGE